MNPNSKTTTAESVQSITRYDRLLQSGRTQRHWRPVTSAVSVQLFIKYGRTVPRRHQNWALRAWIVLYWWHQASEAHHALVATNHCRTSECYGQLNSSLSATCLLWLSATQLARHYSSRREMSQMLAWGFWPSRHPTTAGHDESVWDERSR